jgi:hypothetical protein
VTTPVKQKNVQVAAGSGEDILNTLINLGNLAVNAAGAGGSIAGAVAGFLNTFLPDCPPPIDGAPPIPGCQVIDGLSGLVDGVTGGQPLSSTVVNVNSPNAVGADVANTARPPAAAARPGPPANRPPPPRRPSSDEEDRRSATPAPSPKASSQPKASAAPAAAKPK